MIKTILWDFDGVILDSMKIKGDGFKELFKDDDEKYLLELEKYHYKNGGISRFEKIKYFYTEIMKKSISKEKILKLADKFALIIANKLVDKNNLIKETIDFIKANYKKYNFHIVSGAEHKELDNLCKHFELSQYFITINGSPTKKSEIIKNILDKYEYKKNETILIGDSINDYNSAIKNGIGFYGFNNVELEPYSKVYIENYKDTF